MDKLRVFTAFSGYDSQCMAIDRLEENFPGFSYELVGWSEIDKYAIQAHNAVYPKWADRNFGDISKIDWANVPDFDLFTYSFPCQDISSAGKQRGLQEGSGTRSSLLWECQKAIEIKRPKYCLMENVAALVTEKFLPFFLEWERLMARYGYTNHNRVLDAKNYGIPQHRERIFMVSILNSDQSFYWPEPIKLEKRLKDVLEKNADEKYYLSGSIIEDFRKNNEIYKERMSEIKYIGQMSSSQNSRVIDPEGISYAVTNGHKDGEPKIIEPYNADEDGCAKTILAGCFKFGAATLLRDSGSTMTSVIEYSTKTIEPTYRIRKLTPKECFRLMGVSETDIDKIQKSGISNTRQFQLAGNSIVVDVLEHIFRKMFVETEQESQQLSLF